jgi:hypothetical protein
MILQDAEQLGLHFQWNFPNLIEEERASIGQFEAPDFLADGTGKCAFFVAEQFAFQQTRGNSRAVQGHKKLLVAAAGAVNGASDQSLSRTGLAQNQHTRVAAGDDRNLIQHLLQRRTLADNLLEM